ncbi:YheU family protein [Geobacter sp. AOG1]|uniref:YheU family protein n=1 Tax=Geobacter sp. AOG1 TaxID=1566346 RepID=UPI001CC458DF|nr:YheU family protein [Geobacter sp. AOG1]GFE56868.1 hypothetical protein AOG1_07470 [Geobacter sp. AOG1]
MTPEQRPDHGEEGIEVPYDRISPETLRNMIEEFVTREWADLSDSGHTLDDKVNQVMQQLREGKVKVVFDFRSETGNIVVCR